MKLVVFVTALSVIIILFFLIGVPIVQQAIIDSTPTSESWGCGPDHAAAISEYYSKQTDIGTDCTSKSSYSTWTRYVCIFNISQDITPVEKERGATSRMQEYFAYSYIYDNTTISLEPNALYYIEYDLQTGYCKGWGKITKAEKVKDHCDECTIDPDGRLQGCCKDVGCNSPDGRMS